MLFNNDGEGFDVEALENTRLFIGSGEPLNEPLATHGPFVMNSQTQIMEAFRDYQMVKWACLLKIKHLNQTINNPKIKAMATYKIDASHSEITFKVKHLMISNVSGSFKNSMLRWRQKRTILQTQRSLSKPM